jgi:hypothetical protein
MDIACTLSPTALGSRRARWRRLIARSGLGRDETPDGLRLRFRADPGAAAELTALAAAERECCAWAGWSVEPGDGEIALVARSSGAGVTALHTMLEGFEEWPRG